jgi:Zn-dependent peptidase ImmA (M78 family)/transcriptional regulator with XRE-family HTH domain
VLFNPDMLVLARESRGLTQAQLARAAGVTQGTVSKLEHGEIAPEADLASRLAEKLAYEPEFFAEAWRLRDLPVGFFRKQASVSATAQRRIRAYANVRLLALKKLLHSTEIPECRVQHLEAGEGRLWFDRTANELRSLWEFRPGPISNLTEALEGLGVIVLRADFGTEKVDGISFNEPGVGPVIMVRFDLPGDRWRFTIAHELAHLLFDGRGIPRLAIEDDANAFASAFLLPAHDVKPYLSRLSVQKLASLKQHWGVSMQTIMRRAFDLGLMSERQRRYMYVQLAREGVSRTSEPDIVPREEGTLFKEVLEFHVSDLGYSERQLRKILYLDMNELKSLSADPGPALRVV